MRLGFVPIAATLVALAGSLLAARPKAIASARPALRLVYSLPSDCQTLGPGGAACDPPPPEQRDLVTDLFAQAEGKEGRLEVAYMMVDDSEILGALCRAGQRGAKVELLVDTKEWGPSYAIAPKRCDLDIRYLGDLRVGKDQSIVEWRIQHTKYAYVDRAPDARDVGFMASTGNLSGGAFVSNYEYWITGSVPKTSLFFRSHECMTSSLRKAAGALPRSVSLPWYTNGVDPPKSDNPVLFRDELDACLRELGMLPSNPRLWVEDALRLEGIAALFGPLQVDTLYTTLLDNLARVPRGGSLRLSMQHFTSPHLAALLREAAERGVSVRLLLDDDTLLGTGMVPRAREFYDTHLRGSAIETRFVATNAALPTRPKLHDKFIVFDAVDGERRAMAGSCQFSGVALTANYESEYLISDPSLTSSFVELHDALWKRSLSENEVLAKRDGKPVEPSELHEP
jgi:hypothetical protein